MHTSLSTEVERTTTANEYDYHPPDDALIAADIVEQGEIQAAVYGASVRDDAFRRHTSTTDDTRDMRQLQDRDEFALPPPPHRRRIRNAFTAPNIKLQHDTAKRAAGSRLMRKLLRRQLADISLQRTQSYIGDDDPRATSAPIQKKKKKKTTLRRMGGQWRKTPR
jgi:hypothetical protein